MIKNAANVNIRISVLKISVAPSKIQTTTSTLNNGENGIFFIREV